MNGRSALAPCSPPAFRLAPWLATLLAWGLVCGANSGCAGYRMGTRSLFRTDIRTVHVPIIESDSFRRNLGERLTEAVVKQLELNSPYKVVGSPDQADSVLHCRLTSDRKQILVETRTDEPRAVELTFSVQVDWLDRQGQSLVQRTEVPLPSSLFGVGQATDFVPEAGQSVATAQQAAIENLARQIVGQLEAAW